MYVFRCQQQLSLKSVETLNKMLKYNNIILKAVFYVDLLYEYMLFPTNLAITTLISGDTVTHVVVQQIATRAVVGTR